MTPKKIYSFWINEAEAEALKAVKAEQGIPESEQIRQALRDWFKKQGVTMKRQRKQAATRKRS